MLKYVIINTEVRGRALTVTCPVQLPWAVLLETASVQFSGMELLYRATKLEVEFSKAPMGVGVVGPLEAFPDPMIGLMASAIEIMKLH